MAKIKYNVYQCKDCEIDFLCRTARYCPKCGDNPYLEKERTIWIDKPVVYKRPWTAEDDDILVESVERGIKNNDIANELNRTKDAVAERLRRLRKIREIERGIK